MRETYDLGGYEADIALEHAGHQIADVEVRPSATVTEGDFRELRRLRASTGRRFARGAVRYDSETSAGFGDDLYAVPIRMLWED